MTTNRRPITPESVDSLDMFATEATAVRAADLRECMVLMDPELGTPAMWLDHKMRSTRNSGEVTWFAHNLETGRFECLSIRCTTQVAVMAA